MPGSRHGGQARRYSSGLSLVELQVVILLIGILGGFAVARFSGRLDQSLALQADQLRRDLTHAQILAISRSERLRFSTLSNQYRVERCSDAACSVITPLINPVTGREFVVQLQDGAIFPSTPSILLDNLGRPSSGSGLIGSAPAVTFQLSLNNKTKSVTVAPLTGFAQVQY